MKKSAENTSHADAFHGLMRTCTDQPYGLGARKEFLAADACGDKSDLIK